MTTPTNTRITTLIGLLEAWGGRAWEQLEEEETATLFLERLAENTEGQKVFNHSLSELMFIPGLRASLLRAFRNPARSPRLSEAIGTFSRELQGPNR